ncbi:MAG: SIS domain-containing protein [Acidimicrobiia bacterium]
MSRFGAEIRAQPEAVARFVDREASTVRTIASELQGTTIDWVVIAARGSSDNVARYGQYLLGIRNRLPVALATPSLYTVYQSPPRLTRALVIGISQSGASPDVAMVIEEARSQGCRTLAITADTASRLGRAADFVLDLGIAEKAVAATMTYSTSLAAMALLSMTLGGHDADLGRLTAIPDVMQLAAERAMSSSELCVAAAPGDWFVVGRGYSYGTAFETALKIAEVAGVHAEPYSAADVLHGPSAGIDDASTVILIAPRGPAFAGMAEWIPELKRRRSSLVAISDDEGMLRVSRSAFRLPGGVPEWLSPLVTVIPGQVLALRLAEARGLDPDQPRGLRKITETF